MNFQVRGKSETVYITEENFNDSDEDEVEVNDAVKKVADDMVKKLLLSDKHEQENTPIGVKGAGHKIFLRKIDIWKVIFFLRKLIIDIWIFVNYLREAEFSIFPQNFFTDTKGIIDFNWSILEEGPPKTTEELEEEELLKEIAKKPLESFKNMKDVPDAIAKTYYKVIKL